MSVLKLILECVELKLAKKELWSVLMELNKTFTWS